MHNRGNLMNQRFLQISALIFGLILSNQASAGIIDLSGSGFNIPDNNAGGASSTITIGVDETISNVEVTLFGLNHTWVGDLIARITSPAGTTRDLFFRVGPGFFGDSSNVDGNYRFADGGNNFAAAAAATGGGGVIPGGTYEAATDGDVPISLAAAFAGESTQGDWTLVISDNAGADTGTLGGWGLDIRSSVTAVPEPGHLTLFVIAGVTMLKRRRRGPKAA
jgi:hypothetical protein